MINPNNTGASIDCTACFERTNHPETPEAKRSCINISNSVEVRNHPTNTPVNTTSGTSPALSTKKIGILSSADVKITLSAVPVGNLDPNLKACLRRLARNTSNNQAIETRDYKTLLNYFKKNLPGVCTHQLDVEDKKLLLSALENDFFAVLSDEERTEPLCRQAVQQNDSALELVPESQKTEQLYKIACLNHSRALRLVPEYMIYHWHQEGFLRTLIEQQENNIRYIPECIKNDEYFEIACQKNPRLLKYYPKGKPISDALLALANQPFGSALEFFPEDKRTPELCLAACQLDGLALRHVPQHLRTVALCTIACTNNVLAFKEVPQECKVLSLCEMVCRNERFNIAYLPDNLPANEYRRLCLVACMHGTYALQKLPEQFKTFDFFEELCTDSQVLRKPDFTMLAEYLGFDQAVALNDLSIKTTGRRLDRAPDEPVISDEEQVRYSMRFIQQLDTNQVTCLLRSRQLPFLTTESQLAYLSAQDVAVEDKLQLIELIDSGKPASGTNQAPLICTDSPLRFGIDNPFCVDLVAMAHCADAFTLPHAQFGEAAHRFIIRNTPDSFPRRAIPQQLTDDQRISIAGGRTVQFNCDDGQSLFFKFQRGTESLSELAREGLLYQYLSDSGLRSRFLSELPKFRSFMRLPLTEHLQTIIARFNDSPRIIEKDGQKWVNVFAYSAPREYSYYAYRPDENGDWQRAENGILSACRDAGLMFGMKLLLTGLLPAFHDKLTNRPWIALYSALGEQGSFHSGTFGAWNDDATRDPDIGYLGIRDIGDYKIFDELQNLSGQEDVPDGSYPATVMRKIVLANAICEAIVAALLIRSRLRQQYDGYHYRNSQCLKETVVFVESACNQLLRGLMIPEGSDNPLKQLLGRDDAEYQQWLDRAALEIVYWTALQPGEKGVGSGGVADDCYLNHIQQGFLSDTLYPRENYAGVGQASFFNDQGKLNLGAHNSSFPLVSLMNGLTRMCTQILGVKSHQDKSL